MSFWVDNRTYAVYQRKDARRGWFVITGVDDFRNRRSTSATAYTVELITNDQREASDLVRHLNRSRCAFCNDPATAVAYYDACWIDSSGALRDAEVFSCFRHSVEDPQFTSSLIGVAAKPYGWDDPPPPF